MLVPSSQWRPMIQSMDLRRLCSSILDKTIADPDMYQHGRTKIFFRAGMLAALESFRSGRLNELATVIQKNIRRRIAVKRYKNIRHAVVRIQTWWRGILSRQLVERMRREKAAQRLQTSIRRYLRRKRYLDTVRGITVFQSRECWSTVPSCFSNVTRRARNTGETPLHRRTTYTCCNSPAKSNAWHVR